MEKLRNLKLLDAFKKSSNDLRFGADTKKKKPRDKALRHSRSMPLYKYRPSGDTDPETYDRPNRPTYRGKGPLTASDIHVVMDIRKQRPKATYKASTFQDDTEEEVDVEDTPPTPPPKDTKEMRSALIDQFPSVPAEMPIPFDVPGARTPPRGGRLVVERRLRATNHLDVLPTNNSVTSLPDPPRASNTEAVPDAENLTPAERDARERMNKIRKQLDDEKAEQNRLKFDVEKHRREYPQRQREREERQRIEAEEKRRKEEEDERTSAELVQEIHDYYNQGGRLPLRRTTSNNAVKRTLPLGYTGEVKPRPWASPAVFHDENRPRGNGAPGHQRFASVPLENAVHGHQKLTANALVNTPADIGYKMQISTPMPYVPPAPRRRRQFFDAFAPSSEPRDNMEVDDDDAHMREGPIAHRVLVRPVGIPGTRPLHPRRRNESFNDGAQAHTESPTPSRNRVESDASSRARMERTQTPPARRAITRVKLKPEQVHGTSGNLDASDRPPNPVYHKRRYNASSDTLRRF